MKIVKFVLLVLIFSMSGCGLFSDDDTDKEPSLDSGKDLKIWVGMPYEDAREALLDFNCEDISKYISYEHINVSPFFKDCWISFIDSQIGIIGDKENADDTFKVVSFSICNSQQLRHFKHEDWYSFDKLTVSDGEMNIEGLKGSKIYVGMKFSKAKEIINNAGVSDIVEENLKLCYKTNYKTGSYDDQGQPQFVKNYQVLVSISAKKKSKDKQLIESIYISWVYEPKNPQYSNTGTDVKCGLIDVKYPHGLHWGAKIIE